MIIITTKCGSRDHPEFVLEADETQVPATYLQNVVGTIEQMVMHGSVFKPDQTFQVGWMITLVQRHADGVHLTLAEPDMQVMPIRWVGGITHTLRQMMLQLFMLDSFALRGEIDLPTIRYSAIVCSYYTDADMCMVRSTPHDAADSGWYIGCMRNNHNHNERANLRRISLYEAYINQRGIQGFAGFPVGSSVIAASKDGLEVRIRGKQRDIVSGTFLEAWIKKSGSKGMPPESRI
jgi:hypothetical protein